MKRKRRECEEREKLAMEICEEVTKNVPKWKAYDYSNGVFLEIGKAIMAYRLGAISREQFIRIMEFANKVKVFTE